MTKVRQSAENIYDPEIVPLDLRPMVIQVYVHALRAVFIVTTGFVVLNLLTGMMLKEHTLHEKIGRDSDAHEGREGTAEGVNC